MIDLFWNRGKKKDWACPKCGKINHPDGEFCEFCGHSKHKAVIIEEASTTKQGSVKYMAKCPKCGTVCVEGIIFCRVCGAALKKNTTPSVPVQEIVPEPQLQEVLVRCVHCGTMNNVHNRFCSHCSEEIRAERAIASVQEKSQHISTSFCPECGARCSNDTTFCNECGAKITIGR